MTKLNRHRRILDIIQKNVITTQDQIVQALQDEDFKCTQGTISRDIRELRLVKVLDESGEYKYAAEKTRMTHYNDRLRVVFGQSVLSVSHNDHMIVLRTIPAGADPAAGAVDTLNWPEILGCIAGEDTVFVAIASGADIAQIAQKFTEMLKN